MNRRTLLKGLGAGGVVVAGGLVAWQVLDDDEGEAGSTPTSTTRPPTEAPSSLAAALGAVGTRYLEVTPEEADQQVLLDALPALNGQVPERPGTGLAVLAPQAEADHESGDTVDLDGWVLSRTECRAAALYAI